MKDKYFEWLLDISSGHYCRYLYQKLYNIKFTYSISRDEDCAHYGLLLRDMYKWEHEYKLPKNLIGRECSVLEVMIALAKLCVSRRNLPMTPDRICDFMEDFFYNLGITVSGGIEEIIDHFLKRDYGEQLEYCMFPSDRDDLEEIDLLYQMELWLKEKFR